MQSVSQLIPPRLLVTVPVPAPALTTVSLGSMAVRVVVADGADAGAVGDRGAHRAADPHLEGLVRFDGGVANNRYANGG